MEGLGGNESQPVTIGELGRTLARFMDDTNKNFDRLAEVIRTQTVGKDYYLAEYNALKARIAILEAQTIAMQKQYELDREDDRKEREQTVTEFRQSRSKFYYALAGMATAIIAPLVAVFVR